MNSRLSRIGNTWKHWPHKGATLIVLIIGIAAFIGLSITADNSEAPAITNTTPEVSNVDVVRLEDIAESTILEKESTIEPLQHAPIIARSPGRITAVNVTLGERVEAGQVIFEIDGGKTGNPTGAQVSGQTTILHAFNEAAEAAQSAADTAVELARINLETVQKNQPLTIEQAQINRQQADLRTREAQLALEDARDTPNDQAIRAADIAYQASQLAQDQATISRTLTTSQSNVNQEQAQKNFESAIQARQRTNAELTNQRAQITTQLNIARAQYQLQQVTSPISGEITSLSAQEGEYVNPGQQLGDINALSGAKITTNVPINIRNQITVGDVITIETESQVFSGTISELSDAPDTGSSLWQVDIVINSTPKDVQPGEIARISFPAGKSASETYFLPLDTIVVRQNGPVLFTVDENNEVIENEVDIIGYANDLIEVRTEIEPDSRIIIGRNRTLRAGDKVDTSQ